MASKLLQYFVWPLLILLLPGIASMAAFGNTLAGGMVALGLGCCTAGALFCYSYYSARSLEMGGIFCWKRGIPPRSLAGLVALLCIAPLFAAIYWLGTSRADASPVQSFPATYLLAVVLIAATEEIAFRLILLMGLMRIGAGVWLAVGINATAFALLHATTDPWIYKVILSLLAAIGYSILTIRFGSIYPAIMLHGVWNFSWTSVLWLTGDKVDAQVRINPTIDGSLLWITLGSQLMALLGCIALSKDLILTKKVYL